MKQQTVHKVRYRFAENHSACEGMIWLFYQLGERYHAYRGGWQIRV